MTASKQFSLRTTGVVRFVFVRHGAAEGVEGRCIGHTDVPLSAEGATEIRQISFEGVNVTRLVSSDLSRALQSAQIISESIGVPITTDARLREMNFGEWDGCTWNELEQSDGARLSTWMEHWTIAAPPAGETVNALLERVALWLNAQLAQTQSDITTIVIVAHAGSIRAAICLLTRTPPAKMFEIPVEYARATIVDVTDGNARLVGANVEHVV